MKSDHAFGLRLMGLDDSDPLSGLVEAIGEEDLLDFRLLVVPAVRRSPGSSRPPLARVVLGVATGPAR